MKRSRIIAIAVLVLLVAAYFIARTKQPVEKDIRFFSADSSAVAKICLSTPQDTVIAVKQGKLWRLTHPVDWEANDTQLGLFFSKVLKAKTSSTSISEDLTQQGMYKVDPTNAVQVKLFDAHNRLLDHVFIGNGTNSTFEYGRHEGDARIYQFKDNLTNIVRPDIYNWRSPKITNIRLTNVSRIDVVYTKNAYTLFVAGDSIRYTDKHESFAIPPGNRALYKIVNALENLLTYQFIDKETHQYDAAFTHPDCRITVYMKDKSRRTFTLIRQEEKIVPASAASEQKSITVFMKVDDKPLPLYEMTGDFLNRFTRASGHFKVEFE